MLPEHTADPALGQSYQKALVSRFSLRALSPPGIAERSFAVIIRTSFKVAGGLMRHIRLFSVGPCFVAALVLLALQPAAAEVRCSKFDTDSQVYKDIVRHNPEYTKLDSAEGCPIEIFGTITAADVATVTRLAEKRNFHDDSIILTSNGGDIAAAMQIGRLLRSRQATVVVPYYGSCVSVCVFVLAGATERNIGGKIGLHRPYLMDDIGSSDRGGYRDKIDQLNQEIRRYLIEMAINTNLLDRMLATPSTEIEFISAKDTAIFFPKTDQAEEEFERAQLARKLGTTPGELVKRQAAIKSTCNGDAPLRDDDDGKQMLQYTRCNALNLFDLTPAQLAAKVSKAQDECPFMGTRRNEENVIFMAESDDCLIAVLSAR